MEPIKSRVLAVIEVTLVFVVIRVGLFPWVLPLFIRNRQVYVFAAYTLMILIPILIILLKKEKLSAYGLHLSHFRGQLDIALNAFIPVAVLAAINDWLLPSYVIPKLGNRWEGAIYLSLSALGLLFLLAWLLRKKPGPFSGMMLLLPFGLGMATHAWQPLNAAAPGFFTRLIPVVFYLVFLGPGEEILFRGYIQSRLNQVFGCPHTLFGVSWGWGALIAAFLFGVMHIFNGYEPLFGSVQFSWWWGVHAGFYGLVFAYLREKSGGVAAPALVHGLPQAIASLMLGYFAVL